MLLPDSSFELFFRYRAAHTSGHKHTLQNYREKIGEERRGGGERGKERGGLCERGKFEKQKNMEKGRKEEED